MDPEGEQLVSWCVVAGLPRYRGSVSQPTPLSEGVVLRDVPAWARSEKAVDGLEWNKSRAFLDDTRAALVLEYQASVVLRDNEQRQAQRVIDHAILALWLARPCDVDTEIYLHFDRPGDSTSIREAGTRARMIVHPMQRATVLSDEDLSLARILHGKLVPLGRQSTVWTASMLLWRALHEDYMEFRLLFLWIALEALFGAEYKIRKRISRRLGFFLGADKAAAEEIRDRARNSYMLRCAAVHGLSANQLNEREILEASVVEAEDWLRRSIIKMLSDDAVLAQIDGPGRETFLDAFTSGRIVRVPA
jgi:hypothetical protein